MKKIAAFIFLTVFGGLGYWTFSELYMYPASFEGAPFERVGIASASGFDEAKLSELRASLENNEGTTGMVVLHEGKVVFEYGDIEEVSYIASCRKSVLSMLYGNPVEIGIVDLNQKIGDLSIDEDDGLLPSEKAATVNDIITSRSGVFHVAANGAHYLRRARTTARNTFRVSGLEY